MPIEEGFKRFVEELLASGEKAPDLPRLLKKLEVEEVALEHRDAFSFWKSLSGASRNLMLDNACGRRLKKRW